MKIAQKSRKEIPVKSRSAAGKYTEIYKQVEKIGFDDAVEVEFNTAEELEDNRRSIYPGLNRISQKTGLKYGVRSDIGECKIYIVVTGEYVPQAKKNVKTGENDGENDGEAPEQAPEQAPKPKNRKNSKKQPEQAPEQAPEADDDIF